MAAVVGSPIPCVFTLSEPFQLSDSKLERNVQAFLPSAFSTPPFLCYYHECAKSHRLASNLIFQRKKKRKEIVAFENPLLPSSEGNL